MKVGEILLKTGTGEEVEGVVAELNTWIQIGLIEFLHQLILHKCFVLVLLSNKAGFIPSRDLSTDAVDTDNRGARLGARVVCVCRTRDCDPVR